MYNTVYEGFCGTEISIWLAHILKLKYTVDKSSENENDDE